MKIIFFLLGLLCAVSSFATEKWEIFEVEFKGPKVDNPFLDVTISAEFRYKNLSYFVDGFYDGNQTYKIRFMPEFEGEWNFITSSNIATLHQKSGGFVCSPPKKGNHGPVSVTKTFHFAYADGSPYYPLGTTAYAWVHQKDVLIQQTLQTLKDNAFNKIRMTVMPKYYGKYVSNKPPFFPFEGSLESGWDHKRFNIEFFRHLEKQVGELKKLNIEADVIIMHPYDKTEWGFSKGSIDENLLYIQYLVARLGAYRNVWWSMANEYDIMNKPDSEWETYFKTLQSRDPYRHLKSIHNGKAWYDHSKPWITHLSVQTPFLEHVQEWRETYNKPVINDEFVYEGNVPYDWGNLTAEETVNRFWTIYCRGGYASHGETYVHPENILWWAKGGKLYGESPKRLEFLARIMQEAPDQGLTPLHTAWNKSTYLYFKDDYYLYYYGNSQQISAILNLSDDKDYDIEVIDTWNMTIEKLDGKFSGTTEIKIPQQPYIAVRARANE